MRKLILLFIVLSISACVTTDVDMIPAYKAGDVVPPEQGIVVARVINASAYPFNFNYLTLAPKSVNVNEEEKYQRLSVARGTQGSSTLFASPVKPGQYSLSSIHSYYVLGEYYYREVGPTDPEFGTFKVESGKVTDLGTLIYYRKVEGDVYFRVVTRKDDEGETERRLTQEYPGLFSATNTAETIGWDEDESESERMDTYLNMVQNPYTYRERTKSKNGDYLFLSSLGTMMKRSLSGEWSLDVLETDYDLVFYDENQRGDQLVMDGDANLFLKRVGRSDWDRKKIVPILESNESNENQAGQASPIAEAELAPEKMRIQDIVLGDDGTVFATLTDKQKIVLAQVEDLNSGKVKPLKYYLKEFGWLSPEQFTQKERELEESNAALKEGQKARKMREYKHFSTVEQKEVIYLTADQKIYQVNFSPLSVQQAESEQKVNYLARVSDDQLVARIPAFLSSSRQYTLDGGKTWNKYLDNARVDTCNTEPAPGSDDDKKKKKKSSTKKDTISTARCSNGDKRYPTMNFVGTPVFYQDGSGYAILSHTQVTDWWTGARDTSYYLGSSNDSGESWVKNEKALPELCTNLFKAQDPDVLILGCSRTIGSFYSSNRNNVDWKLEHRPTAF